MLCEKHTAAPFLLLIAYSFAGAHNQMLVELSNSSNESLKFLNCCARVIGWVPGRNELLH
jgi:hypothetical protein